MKKISYLVSVLCMCLAFAACSEDTDRTFYYPTNTEATFAAKTGSYSFGKDDPAEYSITVSRVNTNGNANVEITNNGAEGIFNIPSSIEFVDGENEAIINISFNRSNMEVGKVYPVTIDLPTHISPYLN